MTFTSKTVHDPLVESHRYRCPVRPDLAGTFIAASSAYVSGECIGDLMVPGATSFTRIPRFAYTIASDPG
jgi:hypothetical protein